MATSIVAESRSSSLTEFVSPLQGVRPFDDVSQGVALGYPILAFQAGRPHGTDLDSENSCCIE
jgi:hypothetical protein